MRQSFPLDEKVWLVSTDSPRMQRGLTRSWGGFPPGFDLQHPACSPAPSQRARRRPRLDLNHFLCGIPAGEAQLHEEGSLL